MSIRVENSNLIKVNAHTCNNILLLLHRKAINLLNKIRIFFLFFILDTYPEVKYSKYEGELTLLYKEEIYSGIPQR